MFCVVYFCVYVTEPYCLMLLSHNIEHMNIQNNEL